MSEYSSATGSSVQQLDKVILPIIMCHQDNDNQGFLFIKVRIKWHQLWFYSIYHTYSFDFKMRDGYCSGFNDDSNTTDWEYI